MTDADPALDTWTTLSVTRMSGWTNLYRYPGADGGMIARPAPATLLQRHTDGRRRSVFAVVLDGELVPAMIFQHGYISTIRTDVWKTYSGMQGWLDILFARETGAPLP